MISLNQAWALHASDSGEASDENSFAIYCYDVASFVDEEGRAPSLDEVNAFLNDQLVYMCGHSHDCCGCWVTQGLQILLFDDEELIVRTHYGRNI